jgi:hypothetical protein
MTQKDSFSLTVKVFTLQELTITLWGNANEMPVYSGIPSNYTTDDICPEICCHESINENVNAVTLTKDGTQHKTTAIRDTELKSYV